MSGKLKCVARRMEGGQGHEHIAYLWWKDDSGLDGVYTREQMVIHIEKNGNNSVWCPDKNPNVQAAWVHVHSNGRMKYVQTVADNRRTDNLLSLPLR